METTLKETESEQGHISGREEQPRAQSRGHHKLSYSLALAGCFPVLPEGVEIELRSREPSVLPISQTGAGETQLSLKHLKTKHFFGGHAT